MLILSKILERYTSQNQDGVCNCIDWSCLVSVRNMQAMIAYGETNHVLYVLYDSSFFLQKIAFTDKHWSRSWHKMVVEIWLLLKTAKNSFWCHRKTCRCAGKSQIVKYEESAQISFISLYSSLVMTQRSMKKRK